MPAPNTLEKVLLTVAPVLGLVVGEPGMLSCSAWEMISVSPCSVNRVPSVVMNELTLKTAVTIPLTSPIPMQTISATIRLGSSGMPPLWIS